MEFHVLAKRARSFCALVHRTVAISRYLHFCQPCYPMVIQAAESLHPIEAIWGHSYQTTSLGTAQQYTKGKPNEHIIKFVFVYVCFRLLTSWLLAFNLSSWFRSGLIRRGPRALKFAEFELLRRSKRTKLSIRVSRNDEDVDGMSNELAWTSAMERRSEGLIIIIIHIIYKSNVERQNIFL